MTETHRKNPTTPPPRTPDEERAGMDKTSMTSERGAGQNSRHRPAQPDPETGEVPAGPGDVGLQDRPERNAGSPGTGQMSNKRLGLGLAIAALLAILVFAAVF